MRSSGSVPAAGGGSGEARSEGTPMGMEPYRVVPGERLASYGGDGYTTAADAAIDG